MKKLNISIDMNHPAHVHFFKNLIWLLKKAGHKVLVTVGEKDVAVNLLKNYKIEHVNLGSYGKSILQKGLNIPLMDFKMFQAVKDFKPDLFLGLGSFRASHIAKLMHKPVFLFEDSEPSPFEHLLYLPFATKIFTPDCFRKNFGPKQIKYAGYHELAYLHPRYFSPNKSILAEIGLKKGERLFILRFVAWQAGHDLAKHGISEEDKIKLVQYLQKFGKVLISSEKPLSNELEPFRYYIAPEKMHDALYFADLFIGDSQTMATEAAILGTPTVRSNSFAGPNDMGNFIDLEKNYDLMYSYSDFLDAFKKVKALLKVKELKKQWAKKRQKLLAEKIDVTQYMIDEVLKVISFQLPVSN